MTKNLKFHLWVSHLLMLSGVAAAVAGMFLRQEGDGIHYLIWVAVALVVGSVFYKALTLKCPHCGAFLPAKYKLPEKCPACNKSVLEESSDEKADT